MVEGKVTCGQFHKTFFNIIYAAIGILPLGFESVRGVNNAPKSFLKLFQRHAEASMLAYLVRYVHKWYAGTDRYLSS